MSFRWARRTRSTSSFTPVWCGNKVRDVSLPCAVKFIQRARMRRGASAHFEAFLLLADNILRGDEGTRPKPLPENNNVYSAGNCRVERSVKSDLKLTAGLPSRK